LGGGRGLFSLLFWMDERKREFKLIRKRERERERETNVEKK